MTDTSPPDPNAGPPPEAVQLPAEPERFGDRFDQIKAEFDQKLDELRTDVASKLEDAAEVSRQAINALSDKVDELQRQWDTRQQEG